MCMTYQPRLGVEAEPADLNSALLFHDHVVRLSQLCSQYCVCTDG